MLHSGVWTELCLVEQLVHRQLALALATGIPRVCTCSRLYCSVVNYSEKTYPALLDVNTETQGCSCKLVNLWAILH